MVNIVKYNNPEALDLLGKMIVFNPDKRITVEKALEHPYTNSVKDPGVEDPVSQGKMNFDFDYDKNITKEELMQLIIKEI